MDGAFSHASSVWNMYGSMVILEMRISLSVCILYICARVGFPIICIPNNIVMMHWQFPYVHVMNLRCIPVYETMRCIFYSTSQWRIFLKFLKGFGKNSVFNYCDLPSPRKRFFWSMNEVHMLKSEPVFLIASICQPLSLLAWYPLKPIVKLEQICASLPTVTTKVLESIESFNVVKRCDLSFLFLLSISKYVFTDLYIGGCSMWNSSIISPL